MGSYQGQATLVLTDRTTIEGQATIRTSKRLWEGTIVVGQEDLDRLPELTAIELPTGERRQITATSTAQESDGGPYTVSFASTD
ncbi:hypothetical protein BLA60_39585 [Actinophytocola xinjiangensis]|uniref:Uncharacterized protein n=1 Tax=Actinophytocola xinjiangensis TaxID=485602 RepID=A0A7Z0WER4_9PSEU|nr:hypothetical protein [Actinophytocola xinjiangensis]OLF04723.1 hypothetical protein BLA60_39585 [Actinophytocola xinjiangensis]